MAADEARKHMHNIIYTTEQTKTVLRMPRVTLQYMQSWMTADYSTSCNVQLIKLDAYILIDKTIYDIRFSILLGYLILNLHWR